MACERRELAGRRVLAERDARAEVADVRERVHLGLLPARVARLALLEAEADCAQVRLEAGQGRRHVRGLAQERQVVREAEGREVLVSRDAAERGVDGDAKVGHARHRALRDALHRAVGRELARSAGAVEDGARRRERGRRVARKGAQRRRRVGARERLDHFRAVNLVEGVGAVQVEQHGFGLELVEERGRDDDVGAAALHADRLLAVLREVRRPLLLDRVRKEGRPLDRGVKPARDADGPDARLAPGLVEREAARAAGDEVPPLGQLAVHVELAVPAQPRQDALGFVRREGVDERDRGDVRVAPARHALRGERVEFPEDLGELRLLDLDAREVRLVEEGRVEGLPGLRVLGGELRHDRLVAQVCAAARRDGAARTAQVALADELGR